MGANNNQKIRMKARQKAIERLRQMYPDEFNKLYEEELQKAGYIRQFTTVRIDLNGQD